MRARVRDDETAAILTVSYVSFLVVIIIVIIFFFRSDGRSKIARSVRSLLARLDNKYNNKKKKLSPRLRRRRLSHEPTLSRKSTVSAPNRFASESSFSRVRRRNAPRKVFKIRQISGYGARRIIAARSERISRQRRLPLNRARFSVFPVQTRKRHTTGVRARAGGR